MLLSIATRASVVCPFCNARSPMPGLRSALSCQGCGRTIDVATIRRTVARGGVRYFFGGYYDVLAEAAVLLADGEDARTNVQQAAAESPMLFARRAARCVSCRQSLPVIAPPAGQPSALLACASCGAEVAVRAPDAETREWDPRIAFIVNDAKGREAKMAASEGTVAPCGNCGAALIPEGARRTVRCGRCNTTNFLGDDAWLKLRPPAEACEFFLVYDVDDAQKLELCRELCSREMDSVAANYCFDPDTRARVAAELERLQGGAAPAQAPAPEPAAQKSGARRGLLVGGAIVLVVGLIIVVLFATGVFHLHHKRHRPHAGPRGRPAASASATR